MKTQEQVSYLINCLTKNEDLRQELWVHYLDGNPIESFSAYLKKIQIEYSEDKVIKENLWHLYQSPPSDNFFCILDNFTDFEQSIIVSLILGVEVEKISEYWGISPVRIRQVIASIGYNSCWRDYGIETKLVR